jgi:hypothetical protein
MSKSYSVVIVEGHDVASVWRELEAVVGPALAEWRKGSLFSIHIAVSDVTDAHCFGAQWEGPKSRAVVRPTVEVDLIIADVFHLDEHVLRDVMARRIAVGLSRKYSQAVRLRIGDKEEEVLGGSDGQLLGK